MLQVRGELDAEKLTKQSFPGGCQVTCHGDLQDDEDPIVGLFREIGEELGQAAAAFLENLKDGFETLAQLNTEKKEMTTYGVHVPDPAFLALIPGSSTAGYRYVPGNVAIDDLSKFPRDAGVEAHVTAMFNDERDALETAFARFGNQ